MQKHAVVLFAILAGCAGPIETRIDSAGLTPVEPTTYAIDAAAPELANEARNLAVAALAGKGFREASPAELSLQLTVADRPAQLSLQNGTATLSSAAGRRKCADREYRVGIILTRISDGTVVHHAHAAEYHCKNPMAEVLPLLVDAALRDLGAPRGSYTVKRPRYRRAQPLRATTE
jgi:hypothetical protein